MIHKTGKPKKVTLVLQNGEPKKSNNLFASWVQMDDGTLGIYRHPKQVQNYFVKGTQVDYIKTEIEGHEYFLFSEVKKVSAKSETITISNDRWKISEKAKAITMCARYAIDVSDHNQSFEKEFKKNFNIILTEVYKKIDEL